MRLNQLKRWARRTESKLLMIVAGLVVAGLLAGLTGSISLANRAAVLDDVAGRNGPLAAQALDIYHSLADADAVSANAFLAGGAEPPELRKRFQDSVGLAASAINTAAALNRSLDPGRIPAAPANDCRSAASGPAAEPIALRLGRLSAGLSVYTGLIETARTYNRQGLPLGSSYLNLASTMIRRDMLPEARALYDDESTLLEASQSRARELPFVALPLALLLIAALILVQVTERRRTRRMFNVSLLAATLTAVLATIWLAVASLSAISNASASGTDGTAQVRVLAGARTAALQARTNEAVALISSGNNAAYRAAFDAQIVCLRDQLTKAKSMVSQPDTISEIDAASGRLVPWQNAHFAVGETEKAGDYAKAVKTAIGPTPGSSNSVAGAVDDHLGRAIGQAGARFDVAVHDARNDLSWAPAGFAALIVLTIALAVAGLWPRIAEYR